MAHLAPDFLLKPGHEWEGTEFSLTLRQEGGHDHGGMAVHAPHASSRPLLIPRPVLRAAFPKWLCNQGGDLQPETAALT